MSAVELVEAIKFFSNRGWVPATSSNFSFLNQKNIMISRSGVDKSKFSTSDLILVDMNGNVIGPKNLKASAETLIHCGLYKFLKDIKCVMHTHSVQGTVLSRLHAKDGSITFQGYEVQKAFRGVDTHECEIVVPILSNDQDMVRFSNSM